MTTLRLDIFFANWCTICEKIIPDLRRELFPGVVIHEIDIDKDIEGALAADVRGVPLFRLYRDNELIGSKVGGLSVKQIKEWLDVYHT